MNQEFIDSNEFDLSDHEVVLNFVDCVKDLYPFLIKGNAYCYDSWDNIIEHLYFELVHNYLSWKYFGIGTSQNYCHKYETAFCVDINQAYIKCLPRDKVIPIFNRFGEKVSLDNENIELVFISISDGKHILTGSFEKTEAKTIVFNMVEVELINRKGVNKTSNERYYVNIDEIFFQYCPKR